MSNLFLLPCPSCEATIEIGVRQAGQTLSCSACGADTEAPKLGEIKKLPQAQSNTVARKKPMSSARKGLFTAGLALAVIFGCAGLGLHYYANSLHTPIDIEGHIVRTRVEVTALETPQLYALATALTKVEDLGEFQEPPFLRMNKQGEILTWIAWGLYAIGGLGLLMLIGSFMMK